MLQRRLGHLLQLPDRHRHRLGLAARRALRLGAALLGHVHHLPDVAARRALSVERQRHVHQRVHRLPVVAQEALLGLVEARLVAHQPPPGVALGLAVGRVRQLPERLLDQLQRGAPEQVAERRVHLEPLPVGAGQPHADRGVLEGRPEALLGLAQLGVLLLQLEQHRHLRAQHVGVDRLDDVVHRPGRVAARDQLVVGVGGGEEDHRHVLVAAPPLDQLDGLEAVEAGHAHVHHDHREVVVEQALERLLARAGAHQAMAERRQHDLEREQVLGLVVDQQDVRRGAHRARFR